MPNLVRGAAFGLALASFVGACANVPITGRKQFNIVPEEVMNNLGKQTYVSMLQETRVIESGRSDEVLERVGGRIAKVAREPSFDWQFSLLDEETINAWALPGGYVAVYRGILPVLRNEAGMAAVVGHEVGHATARHGAERLSQNLAVTGGLLGLQAYLGGRGDLNADQQQTILAAIGLGAQVGVLLPYSRTHEAEADVIGMMYMARAGYPPAESIALWKRMEGAHEGPRPPTFLSTHPDPQARRENLREWLPRANKRYRRNALDADTQATLWTDDDPAIDTPVRRTRGQALDRPRRAE